MSKTFLERIGFTRSDDEDDIENTETGIGKESTADWLTEVDESKKSPWEIQADVYQTPDAVFIKTIVAGVRPEDLDVTISREKVTINGRRVEENLPGSAQFVAKELYWGEFTKTVYMPNGVEVEASEAQAEEKHGMLLLKLPKIDKNKETRLRIKSV